MHFVENLTKQRDHPAWYALNYTCRQILVRGYAGTLLGDHITVNEFPKSGGSWPAQMLADCFAIPFPRNRLPIAGTSVLHGHFLDKIGTRRHLIVWRDGRDVAVSWFYHFVIGSNLTSKRAVQYIRKELGISEIEDIRANFPLALRYFLESPRYPRFTWAEFVNRWADDTHCVHVRYEDLLKDTAAELKRFVLELSDEQLSDERALSIAEAHSFERQSSRQRGQENKNSYLRKGIAGDWKNVFDTDSRQLFCDKAGKQLIQLGYEQDNDWVKV